MVKWRVTCAGWTVCETEDEDEALRIYSQQGPYGNIQAFNDDGTPETYEQMIRRCYA